MIMSFLANMQYSWYKAKDDEQEGRWITVGGRRIFIKDKDVEAKSSRAISGDRVRRFENMLEDSGFEAVGRAEDIDIPGYSQVVYQRDDHEISIVFETQNGKVQEINSNQQDDPIDTWGNFSELVMKSSKKE